VEKLSSMTDADCAPRIHIVGTNLMQYDLLSFCLKNEIDAECVFHDEPQIDAFGGKEITRLQVCLLDCLELNPPELINRFDHFIALVHSAVMIVLFNLAPDCTPMQLIKQKKIRGIFYRNDSRDVFLKGIRCILEGHLWLSRKILSDCILTPNKLENPIPQNNKDLSSREKIILQSVASGASNQEIADQLSISVHTVKTHLYKIYRKLNVSNRLQATLWLNTCQD